MKALVVYESMYGNTRAIAEAIGDGLRPSGQATVVPLILATADAVAAADLLVVGGPTHVHGMSSTKSREAAIAAAAKKDLSVEPNAQEPSLRAWLEQLANATNTPAASFDTRLGGWPIFTGRASRGISQRLRRRGYRMVVAPESFLVDKANHLVPGEIARATRWGEAVASSAASMSDTALARTD